MNGTKSARGAVNRPELKDRDTFNVAQWCKAVFADNRLTVSETTVLQNLAFEFPLWKYSAATRTPPGILKAGEKAMLEYLGDKGSRSTLRRALDKAEGLGYLVLVQAREPGKRGSINVYALVLPSEVGSTVNPALPSKVGSSNGKSRVQQTQKYGSNDAKVGFNGNAVICENAEQGSKREVLREGEREVDPLPSLHSPTEPSHRGNAARLPNNGEPSTAVAESEIPWNHDEAFHAWDWSGFLQHFDYLEIPIERPRCSKHPNGTDDPCGKCADARTRCESWDSIRETWQEWNEECKNDIRECTICDARGWVRDGEFGWAWCEHPQVSHSTHVGAQ